ncbi:hypothetical protein GCM10007173_10560 [Glutamicibacter ardleyensis]|uniref:Uncharacterized protein n=1 Tax=Glutamicibacter ardleyensis TaxID=225894 RepID=A0ABQ2DEA5_9MICC|nr:hypothetical protein GCM10007173_10560 [Glutamicibacter ardleyensis]
MKNRLRTMAATVLVAGLAVAGAGAAQADTKSGYKNCASGYSASLTTKLNASGVGTQSTTHSHKHGVTTVKQTFSGLGPNTSNSRTQYSYWSATSQRVIEYATGGCIRNPV